MAAAAGALAATAVSGVAWAAIPDGGGVISGCYLKVGGILRVVDTSKNERCLPNLEVPISWSQRGPKGDPGAPGANGISPAVRQLAAGDTNCPAGGAAITDATGSTAYVCSGSDGRDGSDGQSFAGTFTSPNGQFSLTVTDAGITLARSGGTSIEITANDLTEHVPGNALIQAGGSLTLRGGTVNIN